MKKNVLVAGLLGGLVAFVWLFVSNAIIPIKTNMIHQIAPTQMEVHAALKKNITEPGTYTVPYVTVMDEAALQTYREEPVYTVIYSGYTHGDPGSPLDLLIPTLIIFGVALLAAWMLSVTSASVLSSYGRRVLFVTLIGVLIAFHDDLLQFFMGPQPRDYQVFLAANNVLTWFLMGLVIARRVKPE